MAEPSALQTLIKLINFYARFTPSYTRVGYIARGLPLRPLRADFTGQTWLVTGATGGLGRAASLAAARAGARVFAVGRNSAGLETLCTEMAAAKAGRATGSIVPIACDLSSMTEVSALTRRPALADTAFDVLINNVGVLNRALSVTAEGLEASYATNLLGHYIVTEQLFAQDRLKSGATVINVVSGGLYNVPLNTTMLNMTGAAFNGFAAYGSHKRAQLALSDHWRARFAARSITVHAVHPGWADTAGVATSLPKFRRVLRPILRNARQGVDTVLWLAATRPTEAADQVWFDRKPRTAHVYARTRAALATPGDIVAYLEKDRQAILSAVSRPVLVS